MKQGKQFERLTEKIFCQLVKNPEYENVEHDVLLDGKDGARQIDVLITAQVAGIELKTIVECKDYKGKVSIGEIDKLHSVIQDVNANKGVVVSSNGFSSKAINKAKRLGISLYTAHEALSEKWKIDIEIPILVIEISSVEINPSLEGQILKEITFHETAIFHVNDVYVLEVFAEHFNGLSPDELMSLKQTGNVYYPPVLEHPLFIRDSRGGKIAIDDYSIVFNINRKYYFGYLNEQNDVLAIKDIIENGLKVMFKPDVILDYKTTFTEVQENEIPSVGEIKVACQAKLLIDESQVQMHRLNVELS
ncbi:MAG: restriction endonuclease [Candidatus Thiodiazotropha sp.]